MLPVSAGGFFPRLCRKRLAIIMLPWLLAAGGALPAASLDEIAEHLLSPQVRAALGDRRLALIHARDSASSEFARIFRGKLGAFATVVFTDQKIIQGEIDRQMSGLVDDAEIVSIGHQRGAEIVVQLILCRAPGNPKIRAILTAIHIETNTLAASNAVEMNPPRSFDVSRLPLQKEDAISEVRRMTTSIVNSKAGDVHNDPMPPPREPLRLPRINWLKDYFLGGSALLDFLWIYGDSGNAFGSGGSRLFGMRVISLEYGRMGPGWGVWDRLCFGLSPLMTGDFGYGLDISAGYRLWSTSYDFGNWRWIWLSAAAGLGFMLLTGNGGAPFVPYVQMQLTFGPVRFAFRFSPVESSWFSLVAGLYMQWTWS
jgi:hypothetical protein